jgi:SAM-dependent methyltransferase
MDLGAGWGRLARRLLDEFPNAHVVVHDFSAPMLAAARAELDTYGARASYLQTDLDVDGAIAASGRRFDVIVTSQTLHHLRTERLGILYRDIHDALVTEGVFVNLDRVHRRAAAWVVALERALHGRASAAESPGSRRLDRIRSLLRIRDEAATHGGTRAQHLRLLEAAGFRARAIAMGNATLMVGRSSSRP